tara:strand:+ start:4510 stop:5076 length:567 start_codon:yes stop_codon:yes gene_type:complete
VAWGQALKLAGRGALRSMRDPIGRELVRQSIPGAVLNAGATTLFTGNPLLGLASGGLDFAGSAGMSRGMHHLGVKHKLPWLVGSTDKVTNQVTGKVRDMYTPSVVQNIGIYGTSFGAPMAVEGMFMNRQPGAMQLAGQGGSINQQVGQRQAINNLRSEQLARNTMYQTGGLPYRVTHQYADDIVRGIT